MKEQKKDNSLLLRFILFAIPFNQGIAFLSDLAIQYLLKDDFKLSPASSEFIMRVTFFGWMIKPLWGYITDTFPMCGYRRKSYLVLNYTIQTVGWLMLTYYTHDYTLVLTSLFMINTTMAFINVIGEAIVVEQSQDAKNTHINDEQQQANASFNISQFFGAKFLAIFISSLLSGYMIENYTKSQSQMQYCL